IMARFGSERIRGHGIPEAIEAILLRGAKVEPKVAILKPVSAAIAIGSGGPFGAEGPIIMTGGAVGSLIAQFFHMSSAERKTLLAGLLAALLSSAIYFVEDAFQHLPVHWMWWPAIGAAAVGIGGYFFPQTLGVGYDVIASMLDHDLPLKVLLGIFLVKGIIWS